MARMLRIYKYLIVKSAAFMKPCNPEGNSILTSPSFLWTTPVKQEKETARKVEHPFSIEPEQDSANDLENKLPRFCMAHLCKSFLDKHNNREDHTFDTQELIRDFKVKQRRIYDLMNILEGCGCVKKVAKGRYTWMGMRESQFLSPGEQKGDLTSLRQISSNLKLILFESEKPLSFLQLNAQLVAENNSKQINPTSMRRRTYECCKVFTILRYIQKIGKHYIWTANKNLENINMETIRKESIQKHRELRLSSNSKERKLINEVLRRFRAAEELETFFERIREEYGKKTVKIQA